MPTTEIYSQLSDDDLRALLSRDYDALSDAGVKLLMSAGGYRNQPEPRVDLFGALGRSALGTAVPGGPMGGIEERPAKERSRAATTSLRLASGFGGPAVAGAGEASAQLLEKLAGERQDYSPTAIAMAVAVPKAAEAGVRAARAVPDLAQRTVPASFAKAEAARKQAYRDTERLDRALYQGSERMVRAGERQADATRQGLATRAWDERQTLAKRDVQALADTGLRHEAGYKQLYESVDAAVAGGKGGRVSFPKTEEFLAQVKFPGEGNDAALRALQAFDDVLYRHKYGNVPFEEFWPAYRNLKVAVAGTGNQALKGEVRGLYGAVLDDLEAAAATNPTASLLREAELSFKMDKGADLVKKAALASQGNTPGQPFSGPGFANRVAKADEKLRSRLPDDKMRMLEAFIERNRDLGTKPIKVPATPPKALPPYEKRPFEPGRIEGPRSHPWWAFGGIGGAGATGYLLGGGRGAAIASLLGLGLEMLPPAYRAYRRAAPVTNPLIPGLATAGRVGRLDERLSDLLSSP